MDITEKILKNDKYKKLVNGLSSQTLKLVAEDHLRALKEARRGIAEMEPQKTNDMEYLEAQAEAMQTFAKNLLAKRAKKKSSHS